MTIPGGAGFFASTVGLVFGEHFFVVSVAMGEHLSWQVARNNVFWWGWDWKGVMVLNHFARCLLTNAHVVADASYVGGAFLDLVRGG